VIEREIRTTIVIETEVVISTHDVMIRLVRLFGITTRDIAMTIIVAEWINTDQEPTIFILRQFNAVAVALHLTTVVHLRQSTGMIVVHCLLIRTVEVLLTIGKIVVRRPQLGKS
jgi:hypothetical protein